ncbi:12603_t:CDS:2 [Racocetra persica]|uniref:12603_t:CDS:1 n=1 Tax=Racocetra persica TaxID=160502 RepID=A0ACA9M200_9GLOM|nr:12603_t:CDS:2 [Racocetra persica]
MNLRHFAPAELYGNNWSNCQELNLLKTKIGINIATNFKQKIEEYLEQQLGRNDLNPDPKKAETKKKLEKNQEITLEDIEWQLQRVKTFELWLNKQIEAEKIAELNPRRGEVYEVEIIDAQGYEQKGNEDNMRLAVVPGKAKCEQVRAITIERFVKKLGELTKKEMNEIEEKLVMVLNLDNYIERKLKERLQDFLL